MDDFKHDIAAVQQIDVIPSILDVVCRVTGMGFAAVARVTEDRWIACSVKDGIGFGLGVGGELPVTTTICHEIRQSGEPVIIDHVAQSDAYRDHHTPRQYGFQSYISVPIVRADGSFFGTLCAIDSQPADLSRPEVVTMFRLFGELIAFHLDAVDRIAVGDAALAEAQRTSQLREQFIAVLGHDLRNPLAAVDSGISLLQRSGELGPRSVKIVGIMRESVVRASGLINDVLDFARGRLGGGITVTRTAEADLAVLLGKAVAEARAVAPGRRIEASIDLTRPFTCDSSRVSQLFSNLLGNAITHGEADTPIRLSAREDGRDVVIEFANAATPIPEDAREQLFEPFFRSTTGKNRHGLGLGLYIADQIARAHGGGIEVRSDEEETVFSVRLKGA